MSASKAARWLDLLAYLLQYRFPVTREQIWSAVAEYRADRDGGAPEESIRRKFERDKDELRALGIHIETVDLPPTPGDEPGKGYRLRERDLYLPYLEFTERSVQTPTPYQGVLRVPLTRDEVGLLDRATQRLARLDGPLAAAAASARRKLAFDLPLPLSQVERLLAAPLAGDGARALEVLQRAVAEGVAVRCRYYAIGRDAEEEREIEPYGLFYSWGRWYCVAHSRERQARRVFRLDRMRDVRPLTGAAARFTRPADFSIHDYVGRAPWELTAGAAERVVVRFGFPESRWMLAQGVGEVVEELLDDGGAILAFAVRDRAPFLRWLLTFRAGITVVEPDTIGQELAALRARVAALYARGTA